MRKNILLAIFMAVVCQCSLFAATVIEKHWNCDPSLYPNTMTIVGVVEIDEAEQGNTSLEVGAFCGTECRGSEMLRSFPQVNRFLVFLTVYGEDNDAITFKLYDHGTEEELDAYVEGMTFTVNGMHGTPVEPYEFNFIPYYIVTAAVNPSGTGSVSGAGRFVAHSSMSLTATPNTGYGFVNWTENGEEVCAEPTLQFELSGNRSLVANFEMIMHHVDVGVNFDVAGSATGAGDFQEGSTVTVLATPNTGFLFDRWSENGQTVSTSASYAFSIWENRDLTAEFKLAITDTTASSCAEYEWHGQTYTSSGTYYDTMTSYLGIDSIVALHLTIYPAYAFNLYETACDSYLWNDTYYYESGDYEDGYQTIHGCDSIYTLHLTINQTRPLGNFTYMTPANNYVNRYTDVDFYWDGVVNANQYDFYFWEDGQDKPTTPTIANSVSVTAHREGLEHGVTYYWCVVAKNECVNVESPVRTFVCQLTPAMTVLPQGALDFGEVEVGQNSTKNISVSGTALPEDITYAFLDGAYANDAEFFTITPSSTWNSLKGGILQVTFTPMADQLYYSSAIRIASGSFADTLYLTGSMANRYVFTTNLEGDVFAANDSIAITGHVEDVLGNVVPNLDVDVYLLVWGMRTTLRATSDENGDYMVKYGPRSSESGYYQVGSCEKNKNASAVHDAFDIPGMSRTTNNFIIWDIYQDETVSGSIPIRNRSRIPLGSIQVIPVSVPDGLQADFHSFSLGALETGELNYTFTGTVISTSNSYAEAVFQLVSSNGVVMNLTCYYLCRQRRGDLDVYPPSISTTMKRNAQKMLSFQVTNNGNGETGPISIDLPDVEWMTVMGGDSLASIAVGDSVAFSISLFPDENVPLNEYTGNFAVNCANGNGFSVPYTIQATSDSTGILVVDVTDEYTYNTNNGNGPHLAGASVTVTGYYSLETVAQGMTNTEGVFRVDSLPEGYYYLTIRAQSHTEYNNGIIYIEGGKTNTQEIYLQFLAISASWEVVPTEVADEYGFVLNTEIKTNVPVPVVLIEGPSFFDDLEYGDTLRYSMTVSNHGLVDAYDTHITIEENYDEYVFTPLFDVIDTLHPQEVVIVPCIMTRVDGGREATVGRNSCNVGFDMSLSWYRCNQQLKCVEHKTQFTIGGPYTCSDYASYYTTPQVYSNNPIYTPNPDYGNQNAVTPPIPNGLQTDTYQSSQNASPVVATTSQDCVPCWKTLNIPLGRSMGKLLIDEAKLQELIEMSRNCSISPEVMSCPEIGNNSTEWPLWTQTGDLSKIDPELQALMRDSRDGNETFRVIVELKEQYDNPNLERGTSMMTRAERRDYVVNELKRFSESSQAEVSRYLEAQATRGGVSVLHHFWIFNGVYCEATATCIDDLSMRSDVRFISLDRETQLIDPVEETPIGRSLPPNEGVQWHITDIHADQVWGEETFYHSCYLGQGVLGGSYTSTQNVITINSTHAFCNTFHVDEYQNSVITVSADTTIRSIAITCTASDNSEFGPSNLSLIDGQLGEYSFSGNVGTWTGSANSISLIANGQCRWTKIVVSFGYTGKGVVVAVIDSGVNYEHEDIKDHMWDGRAYGYDHHGWDFYDDDDDPIDRTTEVGHGSHVAGIVSSKGDIYQSGVAPGAKIMALKIFGEYHGVGEGENKIYRICNDSKILNAYEFAVEKGANVINYSVGGQLGGIGIYRDAFVNILNAGVVATVAAGNHRTDGRPVPYNINYPGNCPPPWHNPDQILTGEPSAVICVGATKREDGQDYKHFAYYSDCGPVTWASGDYIGDYNDYPYDGINNLGLIRPDIAAPGGNGEYDENNHLILEKEVWSINHTDDNSYRPLDGTSMATPCVAGVIALMLEANPYLNPIQIDSIIETNAIPCAGQELNQNGRPIKDNNYGAGLVNAYASVSAARDLYNNNINQQFQDICHISATRRPFYDHVTIEGTGRYLKGETCTLTASPASEEYFLHWEKVGFPNTVVSESSSFSFEVTENAQYVAVYRNDVDRYHITLISSLNGIFALWGYGDFFDGQTGILKVYYDNNRYVFNGWYKLLQNGNIELVSTSSECSIIVTEDATYEAKFECQISASVKPNEEGIVVDEAGNIVDDEGIICLTGNQCTLTAIPNPGFEFVGWYDGKDLVSKRYNYTFTVREDKQYTALFIPNQIGVGQVLFPTVQDLETNIDFLNSYSEALSRCLPGENRDSSEGEALIAQLEQCVGFYQAVLDIHTNIFQEEEWKDEEYLAEFYDHFRALLDPDNQMLSPELTQQLIDLSEFTSANASTVQSFVERWNRSVQYWNEGIYILEDLPEGYDSNFIQKNNALLQPAFDAIDYAVVNGFNNFADMYYTTLSDCNNLVREHQNDVCAKVSVQFKQTMAMTREAFEGTLRIHNGHMTDPMQDIAVNITIKNPSGEDCTNLFQINTTSMDKITGVDGTGSLDAQTEGVVQFMMIPTIAAAPDTTVIYSFGGSFSFLDPFSGEEMTYQLYPVNLKVYPGPNLYVDYFVQRNIISDDPLTEDTIEPVEEAEIAMMIRNLGAGDAKNVYLESSQPTIIENQNNLLISFDMTGAAMNGIRRPLGLTDVPFGTIASHTNGIAEWYFTSSLIGRVINSTARVIHNNSYGNPQLSLVSSVNTHELTKAISAYGSLDDGINDFLVNEISDFGHIPDNLYFSNGDTTNVVKADHLVALDSVTHQNNTVTIELYPSAAGWNYDTVEDPGHGLYELLSCTRSDGQEIPLNNVWITHITIPHDDIPIHENILHIVDTLPTEDMVTYTLVYDVVLIDTYEITATANSDEWGAVTGGGTYEEGSTCTLTATPAEGYAFLNWTKDGEVVSTESTYSFTVTEAGDYIGNFGLVMDHVITLEQGWNWWSSYINLEDTGLSKLEEKLTDNGILIKSYFNGFVRNENGIWYGTLQGLHNENMYMIQTNSPIQFTLSGVCVNPSQLNMDMAAGWNWIGYPLTSAQSVDDALSQLDATNGDVLKTMSRMCVYDVDSWYGPLSNMYPGQGYMLYSDQPHSFNYVGNRGPLKEVPEGACHWSTKERDYEMGMCFIATVAIDGVELRSEAYELAAFCNGVSLGATRLLYNARRDRYYALLPVAGEEGMSLSFRLYNAQTDDEYTGCAEDACRFVVNGINGSLNEPVVLHFGEKNDEDVPAFRFYPNPVEKDGLVWLSLPEGVGTVRVEVYTMMDVLVASKVVAGNSFTVGSNLSSGAYILRVYDANGKMYYGKLIIE